jgi:diguanylate cyclase (GGDEF)-like protein/PAS domain S-box-containing protein
MQVALKNCVNTKHFDKYRHYKQKIILFSIFAAPLLWVGDAAIDAFVFRQGSFTDLLVYEVTLYELYFRTIIISALALSVTVITRVVVKRGHVSEALRESNETLRTIADAASDAIVMMNNAGKISFWNPAAEKIFGYKAYEAIGREMHTLLLPQRYCESYQKGFGRFQSTGEGPSVGRRIELTAKRKDGEEFPAEISLSALPLKGKWYAVGILRDITERKKADEELKAHRERLEHLVAERTDELHAANELLLKEILDRSRTEEELYRSESFLNTIFESFHEPFNIVDRDYKIIKFNAAFTHMREKRATDIYGKKCYAVLHNRNSICKNCLVERTFQSKDPYAKEKVLKLSNGSRAWVEIYTYPILDQRGNVSYVITYTRNITDRKKEEEEKKELISNLNHLSTTDSLTGILNRRALNDMLNHEIERATRYNSDLSLMLCDVDRFKNINDTYGHTSGDRALQAVTAALKASLRKSDILGRYGGDEFMIILPETTLAGAHSLAEKIRSAVEELELEIPGGNRVKLSLSIGITRCSMSIDNIDTIVGLADTALYASKQTGRNKVSVLTR